METGTETARVASDARPERVAQGMIATGVYNPGA
jgi:hypothetical protein